MLTQLLIIPTKFSYNKLIIKGTRKSMHQQSNRAKSLEFHLGFFLVNQTSDCRKLIYIYANLTKSFCLSQSQDKEHSRPTNSAYPITKGQAKLQNRFIFQRKMDVLMWNSKRRIQTHSQLTNLNQKGTLHQISCNHSMLMSPETDSVNVLCGLPFSYQVTCLRLKASQM